MRKTLLALTSLGLIGCEPSISTSVDPQTSYFEGVVIGESRFNADVRCPYGFSLKLNSGDYKAFNVGQYWAASVDALIDQGDKIKIDKEGLTNSNLSGSNYITIVEKAQKVH